MGDCVFCEIIAGEAPAKFLADGIHGVAIEPLNPDDEMPAIVPEIKETRND